MNIFQNILISCLRQSHNKVFDFSALETKSSETQKKVHQLEKQLVQAQKDLQKIKRESEEKDSIIEEQGVTLAMDCANEKGSNNTKNVQKIQLKKVINIRRSVEFQYLSIWDFNEKNISFLLFKQ